MTARTSRRPFWVLIGAAIGLALADAVFSTVTFIIWPVRMPAWQPRIFSAVWLAALLLTAAAGLSYALRKRRDSSVR